MAGRFTEEGLASDRYRWRHGEKRIKFIVFSMSRPCSDVPASFNKRMVEDDYGDRRDMDLLFLKDNFIKLYDNANTQVCQNLRTKEFWNLLAEMKEDRTLNQFDCFIFVFLTFLSIDGINNEAGTLHFYDGKVALDKIWDEVAKIPAMHNKPKVFLVQADDIKLLQKPPMYTKAGTFNDIQRIPTDSDRITIMSSIPGKHYAEKDKPSFLIQAFVDVITENWESEYPLDLLSLTVFMNQKVLELIQRSSEERKRELPLPCTTSTLKQLLYL